MKHTVGDELRGVLAFIGVIWAVYLLDWLVPGRFTDWGLIPRTLWGLVSIPLVPFLHASFGHLLGNTVPLLVLLILMAGSRTQTWATVAEIILLGGILLWLLGRGGGASQGNIAHVGASGLVYGLIAFLIVAGFRERRFLSLAIALLVGFLYGSTLIAGILPSIGSQISWDGHLYGAVSGAAIAFFTLGQNSSSRQSPEHGMRDQVA